MRTRFFILVCTLQACSNGSDNLDAGSDAGVDVVAIDATTDSPVDAPVDAGSDASVPQTLDQGGKLALWLEATPADVTLGDGGSVTKWKDKSKNHNDATAAGTNPTLENGAIASHDAVHFGAVTDVLTIGDAATLQFGVDQVHIVAVARLTTLRSFFFTKATSPTDGGNFSGLSFFIANGGATDAGGFSLSPYASVSGLDSITWGNGNELADSKFHIISFRRADATHLDVSIDDLTPRSGTVASIDVSATGQAVQVGSLNGPTAPDFSLVEELIVHDATGIVSDADVTNVHAYLKQKYGL